MVLPISVESKRIIVTALAPMAAAFCTMRSSAGLLIHATAPLNFSGTNFTTLTWNANPEPDLAGYEVVMRETTSPDWTEALEVGNATTVTLDISKDNLQFGLRAVDQAGFRSPVAFPQVVTT
jgi:hypothetical protein